MRTLAIVLPLLFSVARAGAAPPTPPARVNPQIRYRALERLIRKFSEQARRAQYYAADPRHQL